MGGGLVPRYIRATCLRSFRPIGGPVFSLSPTAVINSFFTHPRRLFLTIGLSCFGMLAFGILYLQNTLGLTPCPMCVVQRYALILVGLLCLVAAALRTRTGWRVTGVLAVVMAALGAFTAARQSQLQWDPPPFPTCGRDIYGMIESFPLQRVIPMVFEGSGDCMAVDWTLLGLSIANWSFIWFVIFALTILVALFKARPTA